MNNPLYEQINVIGKDYVLSKIDQFLSEDSTFKKYDGKIDYKQFKKAIEKNL